MNWTHLCRSIMIIYINIQYSNDGNIFKDQSNLESAKATKSYKRNIHEENCATLKCSDVINQSYMNISITTLTSSNTIWKQKAIIPLSQNKASDCDILLVALDWTRIRPSNVSHYQYWVRELCTACGGNWIHASVNLGNAQCYKFRQTDGPENTPWLKQIYSFQQSRPGCRLNIKMWSYQYRDPHVKDKTVSRPSYL